MTNGNFEGGDVDFSSQYELVASPAVIDREGTFAVASNPSTVSVYSDWVAFGDHTSGHGLMLIANGAPEPLAVWQAQVPVELGVSYQFSFWAATVNQASQSLSTLQGDADSFPLGELLTTSMTAGSWTQFSAHWVADRSGTVQLSIVDTNLLAGWNDFAVDDVAFACVASR